MTMDEESDDLDDSTKTLLELPQDKTPISDGFDDLMMDLLEATIEYVDEQCVVGVQSREGNQLNVIDYDNHIDHEWVINAREKELMKPKSLETAEAVELKAKMNVVVKQSMSSPISQQFQLSTAKLIVVLTLVKKQLLAYEDVVERNLGFEVEKKGAFISKLEDTFTAILTFLDTVYELLNGMCLLKCTTMSYKADNRMLFLCGTNKNEESFIVEWNESGGDAKRTYQGLCKNPSAIV
ncbi:hypothetical protein V6N11_082693 [Hibiscus sabdariffa]|uniref:Uncharacterized protein n=1 Tax=Hibiscus sabdariffa TaxID=183260 RepID=A0ABR2A8K8_9ROSI